MKTSRPLLASPPGLRSEVLLSLGLVMLLATIVLVAVFIAHHEGNLERVLGRSLLAEAARPAAPFEAVVAGTEWWSLGADGKARARGPVAGEIDRETLNLAERVRIEGEPLLQLGRLGGQIRFAAPLGRGGVAMARLPEQASFQLRSAPLTVVATLGVVNMAIFTAFGSWLLRRRLIRPLEELARAAVAIGQGEEEVRAPEEGPQEILAVGCALNEMTEALQERSGELEKAVKDLRGANRELRRTREGLDRAERLASVGRLAAGVAHEVGNPIGAMLAFVDLAARDAGLEDASREHLRRAGSEGERVRVILRQLLDFSRPERATLQPMEFASVARETLVLVSAGRRHNHIAFSHDDPGDLPLVMGDPSSVTQILLNLLLNAADAVGDRDGARVTLLLRAAPWRIRPEDEPAAALGRVRLDAVECVVCDDGCGIPERDRERIFDPFYTTKPPGEGTGLGLANSARLAEELGGVVECVSPPEGFTTAMALRLPVAEQASRQEVREWRVV
ncbi:MAG: HAMP domain-containing protein [bacterium]|nr:HAMP domain-containing protein [bacterium]